MALYSIESEQCLGMSHSGAVTVNGESAVELSDEEVDILVKLIKEKDTTDVEDLDLKNLHPDIYEKLRKAYYKMAYDAEEMHWLWEGYYNGYYEYDFDELKDYCKKECTKPSTSGSAITSAASPMTKLVTFSTTIWMPTSIWMMWHTPLRYPKPSSTKPSNSKFTAICLRRTVRLTPLKKVQADGILFL